MKKYYRFITDIIDKIYPEDFIAPKTKYQVKEFFKMFPEDWQEVSPSEYYIQEGYLPEEYIVDVDNDNSKLVEVVTNYYKDYTNNTPYKNWLFAVCGKGLTRNSRYDDRIEKPVEELPIFTYDQYKQLFYKDNFVLPNNWWVRVTEENVDVLREWSGSPLQANKDLVGIAKITFFIHYLKEYEIGYNNVGDTKGEAYDFGNEITYEQFLKYVLKKEDMKEKGIIGYKLKDSTYREAAEVITDLGWPSNDILTKEGYLLSIHRLTNAKVLDIWFEPVYKEDEFKIEDWVYVINGGNGAMGANKFVGKICTQKTALELTYGGEDKYVMAPIYVENNSSSWGLCDGYQLRKATPEEIEAAQIPKIEINGYKGEFFSNYVKFGCAEIQKELFTDLYRWIDGSSEHTNREIENVTIGKGIFSKKDIIQIAEYYLNK